MRPATPRIVAILCVAVVAALTSERADWRPMSLVVALAATMIVADVLAVRARRVRISAGLMVQVVAMALLGPAPAAVMGVIATLLDGVVNRVRPVACLDNMAVFGLLGLVGGLLFEVFGAWWGLSTHDSAYALLMVPVNFVVAALKLGLAAVAAPDLAATDRRRVFRESGVPTLPLKSFHALMATAAVLVLTHAGLAAAPAVLLVLLISVPLLGPVASALRSGDDLLEEARRVVRAEHLGLAMVRRRVEDAGGALDIATRLNRGTQSRMTLPLEIGA